MASTRSSVRSKLPTTIQELVTPNSLRHSSATPSSALANTTNSLSLLSGSDSSSQQIRPLPEHTGSNKHCSTSTTPAVPGFLEAGSATEEENTPDSNASIDINSRQLSFMAFIRSTVPTMEGGIRIRTENQVRQDQDYCVKPAAGRSRRERILRFFGRHHKKQESNADFLVPGLEVEDRDREILDRLDLSILNDFE